MNFRLLKHVGFASLVAFTAACASSPTASTGGPAPGTGQLELFTWWTTGGNAKAFQAESDAFKAKYPNVSVVLGNQTGGGGSVAKQVIAMRMAANNPPDVFQGHAGKEIMATWVRPPGVTDLAQNKLEDISAIYKQEGWDKTFNSAIVATVTDHGGIFALPVSVHKENGIFYSKKVFADNSLTPPATLADFYAVGDALLAKGGIAPIAIGLKDAFSITMIFADVLLSKASDANPGMGAQWVTDYWAGKKMADDPIVVATVSELTKLTKYMNPDMATLSYANASKKLADGSGAMMMMGDWLSAVLSSPAPGGSGLTPVTDFDIFPFPGTADTFVAIDDVWVLPKGLAPQDNANALAFLRLAGSAAVSTQFALNKFCVPPRSDIDKTLLSPLAQRAFDETQTLKITPSMANGMAAPVTYLNNVQAALVAFMTDPTNNPEPSVVSALKSNYPLLQQ